MCGFLGLTLSVLAPVHAQESPDVPVIGPAAPGGETPAVEPPPAGVPTVPGAILEGVVVQGNQRVEPETIVSYMSIRQGDAFGVNDINESLKRLFATGLFADVAIRREGNFLIVRVVENPIINRIAFEGNLRVKDEVLEQEVQLRPRVVYTRTRVQSDVKRILDVYRRSGRFGATVEPKIILLKQNRVDLVFEIAEGPLTEIKRVSFIGNRRYSDRTLKGEIFTRESAWYRFFSPADTYDPDQLAFDQESLRRFYLKNGYADFRVLSAVAELTPDKDAFFITFTIEEGERYKFGKLDVVSKIPDIEPEPLKDLITVDEGDWYNAGELENSILELTTEVGNQGYAFVDVRPNVRRDRESSTIAITFEIQEGPRVFVERIDIGGNVRTLDQVIRREFRVIEGDAFNAAKLNRSRQRIRNLGFFSRVDVTNEPGSAPDKTVVKVDVAEQSTGELGLGAGFSTTEGVLANLVLRERNLLGKGQDLRATITVSQIRQQFDIGFTEPYFLDRNLKAGIDLFHTTSDNSDFSSFKSTRTGGGLRLGYEINERWSQRLRYTLKQDVVENVPDTASLAIKQQEGTNLTSLIGQDLMYDLRDSSIDTKKGFFARLSTDYAGVGGDLHYVRGKLSTGVYYPVTEDIVGSLTMTGGIIRDLEDEGVRITDRYFLGGSTLRGFQSSGVGPRDLATGDSLGGKQIYYGSLQFRFPIGLPDEFGITGSLFSDFGSLSDIDEDPDQDLAFALVVDEPSLRASWGIGIAWKSPVGPLSMDFAWPLKQEEFDKTEVFRLSFGTRF
ncbi:MAG: outer membrane protein assembly factor BamA [Alphaproteobacteria bacterium]|nr:outer membrane protein assembly factor BamA [Alphaproteobacteria bacterium]